MRIEIKWNSFFEAVRANKISEVEKFLKRNSLYKNDGSEYKDQFGWSPLSLSLELKYKEISLLLVENGADVESTDNAGISVLSRAAWRFPEFVPVLIKSGANPNNHKSSVWSPLMHAFRYNPDCSRVIAEAGADLYFKDDYGNSAVSLICEKSDFESLKFLFSFGFKLKKQYEPNEYSPFWYVIFGHEGKNEKQALFSFLECMKHIPEKDFKGYLEKDKKMNELIRDRFVPGLSEKRRFIRDEAVRIFTRESIIKNELKTTNTEDCDERLSDCFSR